MCITEPLSLICGEPAHRLDRDGLIHGRIGVHGIGMAIIPHSIRFVNTCKGKKLKNIYPPDRQFHRNPSPFAVTIFVGNGQGAAQGRCPHLEQRRRDGDSGHQGATQHRQ